MDKPEIAVIMGSQSDWKIMQYCTQMLDELSLHYHSEIISAHRTPERMVEFAQTAQGRGFKIIIAGAGGAAHLPGMVASLTLLPVLGVPVSGEYLSGQDSLLSIVQMPGGIPVGTLAIGKSGAKNAALLAARILAVNHDELRDRLAVWQRNQTESVVANITDS